MSKTDVYVKWLNGGLKQTNINSPKTLAFPFKANGAEVFNKFKNEVMEQRGYAKC